MLADLGYAADGCDITALVDNIPPSTAESTVPCLLSHRVAFIVLANNLYPTPTHWALAASFQWAVASVEEPSTSFAHHLTEGVGGWPCGVST